MHVEMLTTSFPKFDNDSHAPWILSMAKGLVDCDHSVKVVAPSARDIDHIGHFGGVQVVRFRYHLKPLEQVAYGANIPANLRMNKLALLGFPFFVIGFLFSGFRHLFRGDIVHAQFGYSGVFALVAKLVMRKKTPLVVSFYGRDVAHAKKHPVIYRYVFRHAHRVLVLSKDMRDRLLDLGCDKRKLDIHHLGVDIDRFSRTLSKKLNQNKVTFLVVANFVKKKGIDTAVSAFARIVKSHEYSGMSLCLTLVGRGPEEKNLRALVEENAIEPHVKFINNYIHSDPRQTVINMMSDADVFLLPSATTAEDYGGTPIVLMEAGAMSLPSITVDDAGNSEIVINGQTGIVVPAGDAESFREAMEGLIGDSSTRAEMGAAARKYVINHFNQKIQMSKLETIYQSVVSDVENDVSTRL